MIRFYSDPLIALSVTLRNDRGRELVEVHAEDYMRTDMRTGEAAQYDVCFIGKVVDRAKGLRAGSRFTCRGTVEAAGYKAMLIATRLCIAGE